MVVGKFGEICMLRDIFKDGKILFREDFNKVVKKSKEQILDFSNITFISISAYHELLQILKEHKIIIKNLDESLSRVLRSQNKSRGTNINLSICFS